MMAIRGVFRSEVSLEAKVFYRGCLRYGGVLCHPLDTKVSDCALQLSVAEKSADFAP